MTKPKTTMGNNRGIDAVTPQESRMAQLMSYGYSQTSAYVEAFNKPRTKTSNASARASEIASRPRVRGHLKALYRERKKSQMVSDGEYMAMLLSDRALATAAENWTAVMQANRLIGQATANLSETVNLNDERMTDEQLIERLGASNPELAAAIQKVVGGRKSFH